MRRKASVVVIAALLALAASAWFFRPLPAPASTSARSPQGHRLSVAVLVLTTFGSVSPPSGETGPWIKNEKLPQSFTVAGLPQPIRCTAGHRVMCVAQTEETKENSGPSLALIARSPWRDARGHPVPVDLRPASAGGPARIMLEGIAGTPFHDGGTLGGVCIAKALVDGDLGSSVAQSRTHPFGWDPLFDYGPGAFTQFNPRLVRLAYHLTKNLALEQDAATIAFRAKYPRDANGRPKVITGVDVGMDDFFVGSFSSHRVDVEVAARSGGFSQAHPPKVIDLAHMPDAKYRTHCASDFEDTPVEQTAERLGFSPAKGDILFVRSASDIEEEPLLPKPWSTDRMIRFLQSPSGFPGIVPAFNNGYRVAAKIAHYLLNHPGLKF